MSLIIQDQEADFTANNTPTGIDGPASVTARPNVSPFWVKSGSTFVQDLSRLRTAVMDSNHNWFLILPWPSESNPTTVQWTIIRTDGTALYGTIPEGVSGPVSLSQLLNSYGWSYVTLPITGGPVSVIQGPPGVTDVKKLGDVTVGPGGVSTVQFTVISGDYHALRLVIHGKSTGSSGWEEVLAQFNNDTGANYNSIWGYFDSLGGFSGFSEVGLTNLSLGVLTGATETPVDLAGTIVVDMPGYADPNFKKSMITHSAHVRTTVLQYSPAALFWFNNESITSIKMFLANGNFTEHTRFTLYGFI